MKNVLVVSNFSAGRQKAVQFKKVLHKFLLQNCQKFKFVSIEEFDSSGIEDFDTIIAMGGDGTVSKIAPFIANSNKKLAIIPTGTANLFASALGLTSNLKKTLKIIEKGYSKLVDMMLINGTCSVLRCGFGWDSDIICKTPQSLKNKFGYFSYFIAGILFAFKLTPKEYEIIYEDKDITTDATCIIVANCGNMFADLVSVADHSKTDDGILDIFVLKASNPITFFVEFLAVLFGKKTNSNRAMYFKTKKVEIKNHWAACHIDGEKTKIKGDIKIEVLPKAISVFAKN